MIITTNMDNLGNKTILQVINSDEFFAEWLKSTCDQIEDGARRPIGTD